MSVQARISNSAMAIMRRAIPALPIAVSECEDGAVCASASMIDCAAHSAPAGSSRATKSRHRNSEKQPSDERFLGDDVLRLTPDAVIAADNAGNVCFFNQAAQQIFGYTPSEILGRPLDVLIPPRFRAAHQRYVQQFQQEPWGATRLMSARCRIIGLRKSGEEFPAEAAISQIRLPGSARPGGMIVLRDVSDRVALEGDLRETTRRFNAVFDQAYHFVSILGPDGTVLAINQRGLEVLNQPREAVAGKRIWDVGEFSICADTRRTIESALRKAALGETVGPVKVCLGPSGRVVVEFFLKGIRGEDGAITLVSIEGRDVSDHAQADQRLRATQAHLLASQRIARLGHWVWNLASGEMEWSEEMHRLCGRELGTVRPSPAILLDTAHPDDRAALAAAMRQACRGTPFVLDYRILPPCGNERIVSAQAEITQGSDGRAACITCVVHDVTEQRHTEESLKAAKRAAEAASRAKTEFLKLMSHELRTPLNAIIGFSGLIADKTCQAGGNGRYCEYAQHILASGRQLLDLINRILNLARLESGNLKPDLSDFGVDEVIKQCLAVTCAEAQRAGLVLRPGEIERLRVRADKLMVSEVVLNLLSNAIKFTEAGGTVTVDATSEPETGQVVIRVTDTGIGMSEDEIPRALEPFSRILARSASAGGIGLGLPLSKAFVELHGGSLSIASAPRRGTTVSVRLPQRCAPKAYQLRELTLLSSRQNGFEAPN